MFVLHLFRSKGILGLGIDASETLNFFRGGDKDWEINRLKLDALNGDNNFNNLQHYYYTNHQLKAIRRS